MHEFIFLLIDYIEAKKKWLEYIKWNTWHVTPIGWEFFNELKIINPESNIAFVAMWFDAKTNEVYQKAIQPAIIDSGYKDLRIDRHEHNNKIDDEIIAGIRRSKFVVCDFTG